MVCHATPAALDHEGDHYSLLKQLKATGLREEFELADKDTFEAVSKPLPLTALLPPLPPLPPPSSSLL